MSENTSILCADLESSGLLNDLVLQGDKARLHNFCATNIKSENTYLFHADTFNERERLSRFLDREIILVMHNGIMYDDNALKHFGYNTDKITIIDTLPLSWYLDLDRPKHGLESYGEEAGVPKPEIKDWESLTQEDYDHRVKEDVKIQLYTYKKLKARFEELYGKMTDYQFCTHSVVRYLMFKMKQLNEQQLNKIRIDVDKCKQYIETWSKELDEKMEGLVAVMPKVPEYVDRKPPAKPFKKDGGLSATGIRWKELTESEGLPFEHNEIIKVVKGYAPPNPQSSQQVKEWLDSFGWQPETFRYVKEEDGSERKIPQIYIPNSGGQICQSIEKLAKQIPEVEYLVGVGVIKHRIGVLKGFLDSLVDGEFVEAGASGFTNTLRLKHRKPMVNLPSVRVLYGKEVRSCIIAGEGEVLLGADLTALENVVKFNLQLPYDREYVMSQQADDFDVHLDIAIEANMLSDSELHFYLIEKEGFSVDRYPMTDELKQLLSLSDTEKRVKIEQLSTVRSSGKTANYCCQYSGGAAAVARGANVSMKVAKKLVSAYRERNWSLDAISNAQKVKDTSHGKYILNPINKIWYRLKNDKDRFSVIAQSSGAYIFDLWMVHIMKLRGSGEYGLGGNDLKKIAEIHDECLLKLSIGNEGEAERLVKDAIVELNKALGLEIKFDCDVQFGKRYSDVH